MTPGRTLLVIGIAAVCTFLTRAFPFLLFGGKKELSDRKSTRLNSSHE